jgi:hypothetical protein
MSVLFKQVRTGELFECNGNLYTKQSTRTGKMVANGRTFYISATTRVVL